jgi:hypothetical protein
MGFLHTFLEKSGEKYLCLTFLTYSLHLLPKLWDKRENLKLLPFEKPVSSCLSSSYME